MRKLDCWLLMEMRIGNSYLDWFKGFKNWYFGGVRGGIGMMWRMKGFVKVMTGCGWIGIGFRFIDREIVAFLKSTWEIVDSWVKILMSQDF